MKVVDSALSEIYVERSRYPLDCVPIARPHDHTMVEDLDSYVDQRVLSEAIRVAVIRGAPIEVHGIYPAHFDLVAPDLGLRVQESLGSVHRPGKMINGYRPELFWVRDPYGRDLLCVAVPPGLDYLVHYASLVAHAVNRHTSRGRQLLRLWRYPNAERSIAQWTGLDSAMIDGADTVVFGKIELLDKVLNRAGYDHADTKSTQYYVSSTFSRFGGQRVTLLGVRFSYWGSIGGLLARQCCELGARDIVYVGKLGTLEDPKDIYGKLFVPSHYGLLSGMDVRYLSQGPPNRFLGCFPALDSGLHISVPTVLEETYSQRELASLLGARTMDNELAQMALAVHDWNRARDDTVSFSGLHYATDYLRRRDESELDLPFSLARGRTPEARRRRRHAEQLIGDCLRTYFDNKAVAA